MFVGRTRELAAIADMAAMVTTARAPAALLVVGTPGLGKTSLLEEARNRLKIGRQLAMVGYEPSATCRWQPRRACSEHSLASEIGSRSSC